MVENGLIDHWIELYESRPECSEDETVITAASLEDVQVRLIVSSLWSIMLIGVMHDLYIINSDLTFPAGP